MFEYSATFTFSLSAICILLSNFSIIFSFISSALLIVGTFLVISGLSFGFREIFIAISSLGESSKVIEKLLDKMWQKFNQSLTNFLVCHKKGNMPSKAQALLSTRCIFDLLNHANDLLDGKESAQ